MDSVDDGEKAIKITEKSSYDLILMDIALPGIDGVEATRIIKSMAGYKNVPVVALTAFAMAGDKERLLNEGFSDYISKPLEIQDFIKKMDRYRK